MPSTLPLQCLSCKYLNFSDAIFCTVCSKKLGARPCQQCGAIDDLAAKNCRKCGASFTQPLQPEHQASCASAINVTGLAASTLINTRPAETPPTDLNITRSRQRWLAAIAMLLVVLAMDIFAVYFYYAEPEQLAQAEIEKTTVAMQATPEQRVGPTSNDLNPSSALMPVQAVLLSDAATPRRDTFGQRLEFDSPRVPAQGVNLLDMRPLQATLLLDKNGQAAPQLKECPSAVATLGLCIVPVNE